MKKILLLSIMLFAVAITGCEKSDVEPKEQTLEQQYPEWKNLTYLSTETPIKADFKLDMKIVGNVVTLTYTNKVNPTDVRIYQYREMLIGDANGNEISSTATSGWLYLENGIFNPATNSTPESYEWRFEINRNSNPKTITLYSDPIYVLKIN